MKTYETAETGRRFMPMLPILARIDGRAFHSFCHDLERPYDMRLIDLMVAVTRYMVGETCANIGYTQSDEINLAWLGEDIKSEVFFDGRIFKMTSVLAAMATVKFNELLCEYIPGKDHLLPLFDCRVWQTPSREEAANVFVWREQDATRNSLQMAAQSLFSHDELQGKKSPDLHDMLFSRGVNWNDYPDSFKRGTYLKRGRVTRTFSPDELQELPAKHEARNNPDMVVERSEVNILELPPITRLENRASVLFGDRE
jgi:tRNA(His) 5'-end guanylyltransferase